MAELTQRQLDLAVSFTAWMQSAGVSFDSVTAAARNYELHPTSTNMAKLEQARKRYLDAHRMWANSVRLPR